MPVSGSTAALVATADALAATAERLGGFRRDVGDPVLRAFAGWHGTAAPIAAERLRRELDVLAGAAEACRLVAHALRVYADELARALHDAADGAAEPDPELGADIVQSATDALGFAADDAARAVRDATALLPELVDAEGGTVLDGLVKAGGDVVDEVGSMLSGALDHVNPFSDRFGEAWSSTGATVVAAATDPAAAAGAVVDGVTAPVADSYRTGGVDEAAGRGLGAIAAAVLGGKGVTKLAKLVPEAPPAPVGSLPAMRRVPGGGLRTHDDLGGHTLDVRKAHVGAWDESLLQRLREEGRRHPVSTYPTRLAAERATYDNMRANARAIDAWLSDPSRTRPARFDWEHGHVVGRSAPRDAVSVEDVVNVSGSRVVLKKDPGAPLGYYILTSFPEP